MNLGVAAYPYVVVIPNCALFKRWWDLSSGRCLFHRSCVGLLLFLCKFLSEKYVQYLRLSTVAEYYAFSTLLRTPFIKYDSFFFSF